MNIVNEHDKVDNVRVTCTQLGCLIIVNADQQQQLETCNMQKS